MINSLEALAIGMAVAVLPLVMSERFGSGDALIVAKAFMLAPRVIFASLVGHLLLQKGPVFLARLSMAGLAGVFLAQSQLKHYGLFQLTMLLRSLIGVACATSLLTLQARVIPKGQNMEANGIHLAIIRSIFFLAPFFVKMMLTYVTPTQTLYSIVLLLLVGSSLTLRLSLPASSQATEGKGHSMRPSYVGLLKLFRQKNILFTVFMPLLGQYILHGVLHLFLLWSTIHTFHYPKASYTSLLTAQGIGSAWASFTAPMVVRQLTKKMTMVTLYFNMRILTILSLISLVWLPSFYGMMTLLMIHALPKAMATICFFTLLQKRLNPEELGMVHALTLPIAQLFGLGGSLLAITYTHGYLSLEHFWLLAGGLALSIACSPSLFKPSHD